MDRLNPMLEKTLLVAIEYDGSDRFIPDLDSGAINTRGIGRNDILSYLNELETMGLLESRYTDDGVAFSLSSDARSYFIARRNDRLLSFSKSLLQLATGAVGGLIVWVLSYCASSNQGF